MYIVKAVDVTTNHPYVHYQKEEAIYKTLQTFVGTIGQHSILHHHRDVDSCNE